MWDVYLLLVELFCFVVLVSMFGSVWKKCSTGDGSSFTWHRPSNNQTNITLEV